MKRLKDETYFATRTIRGERRKVKITIKDGKKHINVITPKKRKRKVLPIAQARKFQGTRTKQARTRDAKTTSKNVIRDSRWKKSPGSFDYPGVDTKGKGRNIEKDKAMEQRKRDRTSRLKELTSSYIKEKDPKKKAKIKKQIEKLEKLTNK